ncbi:EamA family transporter [Pseudorhodoferax sp.]|uniref:EamA family transporter n=1 Tax=Pseudorhodoferax sp. TaxID=1993553 RepID=UPI0039E4D37C
MTGGLTTPIVLAVLLGALLHASWNALIKSAADKALDTALIHALGGFVGLALLLAWGGPRAAAWPYIAASIVVHVAYYATLAAAYQHGDLGLTYPVMRGSAPLLVALAGSLVLGERIAWIAWLGVLAISLGVLALGFAGRHAPGGSHRKALGFALTNAALIAVYTVIDGLGVRAAGDAVAYVAALFMLDAVPYFTMVMARRAPAQRSEAWAYMRRRWPVAGLGTLASLTSYGIALWAMTRAPVALVAALRETSVLFAVLIGALCFGERLGAPKVLGVSIIVAGVWLLRLG